MYRRIGKKRIEDIISEKCLTKEDVDVISKLKIMGTVAANRGILSRLGFPYDEKIGANAHEDYEIIIGLIGKETSPGFQEIRIYGINTGNIIYLSGLIDIGMKYRKK